MANKVAEHGVAIENLGDVNEGDKLKEIGINENIINKGAVGKKHSEEDGVEHISNFVTKSAKHDLNTRNSDLMTEVRHTQDDVALKTSDKIEQDEKMLEAIDDPPDSFFDGLLEDDFLDSLAVVDAWNPDADESCGSDAGEQKDNNTGRGDISRNRQQPSESERKHREGSIGKNSVSKSRRQYSDHRRSGDHSNRNDDRRHTRTSVEKKRDSRERSVGKTVHRREKGSIDEYLREVQRRYQHVRDKSRERYAARKDRDSRDSDGKSLHRRVKSRDSAERSIHRRDGRSKEQDTEKNMHGSVSCSSGRENKDKSEERSARKDGKGRGHRYSYQYRLSNKHRTSDSSRKERKLDLHGVYVDGKDDEPQNFENISGSEDITKEILRRGKNSDFNLVNKDIQVGFLHKEHDMEKEMSPGVSDMTEEVTEDQNHMVTKPNNPKLNNTKLDTCIKELDDLVPPGTESDFILPTKGENDEFKKENNARVKEEPEFGIVDDKDPLSGDQKSSRHCMIRADSLKKEFHVAGEKNTEHEIMEGVESEKDPSCSTSQRPHKEAEILDSSHERKRRRSGSSRSEKGKALASAVRRKHDRLDEERKRKPRNSSNEEKKRSSTSLEREFGATRLKSELDKTVRKRRLYGSGRGENCSRSQSREKWQYSSDQHRLKRRKDDQNDSRRSRSGSRGKKCEISVGRERIGRSRSQDRQYRKTQYDTRRSRSGSRGKKCDLSVGRERIGRSRSQDRQYRKTQYDTRQSRSGSRDKQHELFLERESMGRSRDQDIRYKRASSAERWQSDIDARRSERKNDRNESRRLVRSVSRDKEHDSSVPIRILRSHSRDREYRNASSKYQDRQGRPRRSVSLDLEKKKSSLKIRRSPSWNKNNHRISGLSPVSAGHVSLSPSISFELSPSPPQKEWRHLSRSLSRERRSHGYRSYRGSSFSPASNRSAFSRSDSFVSLSSSDESYYRRKPRRKRSPFWKEIERKLAKDSLSSTYNQSAVYPLPSAVGSTHQEGYNPSSYPAPVTFTPAPVTFPPAPVPYPPDPSSYAHGYPSQSAFSDAVIQPPPPEDHIPPSFGSAQPVHLPTSTVMPPTHVPLPVPPPVYNVPPPVLPLEFSDQVAPFSVNTKFSSSENVFSQPLHDTEKSEEPPQVPPPPKISQSCDEKKVSLSSLLEASAKVGGSAKKKRMSVDPLLVVRCEEAIRTLEANDGMILVCPGHLVLQKSPPPHLSAAAVTQMSLDASTFQSPILRKPDLQLSFTSAPVCDEESAESSYDFLKVDTKSVQGQSCSEPLGPRALPSQHAPDTVENFKVHVDSSTMTDIHGDYMTALKKSSSKSQNCSSCLEHSKRIMVWNYTQTPPEVHVTDKIMVWNYTQTPRISVESVGVQAQLVNIGSLRRWGTQRKDCRTRRTAKERSNVKSDTAREKTNKRSSASDSDVRKSASLGGTTALKEDVNKEVTESILQSPRRSHLSTSTNSEGGHVDKDTSYITSSYQVYGRGSFSAFSGGRSDKEVSRSTPVSQSTEPPKGILKTRTNRELHLPSMPLPDVSGQESSLKGCDLPRYSVTSTLHTSKSLSLSGSQREMENSSVLYNMRRGSSSFGELDSDSTVQRSVLGTGSMMSGSTAASFPSSAMPDMRITLSRSQDCYDIHHDRFSPSLRRSGSPGAGVRLQPFQQQGSRALHHPDDPSMMAFDADIHY